MFILFYIELMFSFSFQKRRIGLVHIFGFSLDAFISFKAADRGNVIKIVSGSATVMNKVHDLFF